MFYLFLGPQKEVFKKSNDLVAVLLKKQPDATLLKINKDNFFNFNILDLVSVQGLFFNKNIIVFKKVLEDEEMKETLLENIEDIKSSQNIFLFLEEELDKKTLNKLKDNAQKIQEIEVKEKISSDNKGSKKFNIFGLTDAVLSRDKKNAWLLYLEAIKYSSPEEIYGILWWQLKTMIVVGKSRDASTADMKPFVFNKTKKGLVNFKNNEVEEMASSLVEKYHEARRRSYNMEIVLEKWLLSLFGSTQ